MKKLLMTSVMSISISATSLAADWDNIPIPASAGAGKTWQLQTSYSDEFNYTGKTSEFTDKWKDSYFSGWTGPGLTYWNSNSTWVSDGNLIISASRRSGTNQVNAGVITSKTKVKYPIFLEANIKVSNLELSSNFWLLSENDEREMDILEVYGGAADDWFAKNMSTNFHVFFRDQNNNQIISDYNDQTHNTPTWGNYWRDGFHRFAAYWKSPTEVTYYIDGQETPAGSWSEVIMKDKDYTGAILDKSIYNMDQETYIILDTEDHSWRSDAGIIATDADLADGSKNKMYVDWVRVYKPVSTSTGNSGAIAVPSGYTNIQAKHSSKCIDVTNGALWNGSTYQQWSCNTLNANQNFSLMEISSGNYLVQSRKSGLCIELKDASTANGAKIQQWVCNSANNAQLWQLNDVGNSYFEIKNKASGKCLDIEGKSTSNGANLTQWSCYSGNNQYFKFK